MTQGPHVARITLRFFDYWLAGTGASGTGNADMVAFRDELGCPAMPMTQIKGILRETAENSPGLICSTRLNFLFGARSSENPSKEAEGALKFAGNAILNTEQLNLFASEPQLRAKLFQEFNSTAIDPVTNTAQSRSLRALEAVVPLAISGLVYWVHPTPPDLDWMKDIQKLCAFTPAFGRGVSDGFGWAHAEIENAEAGATEAVAHCANSTQADSQSTTHGLVLEFKPITPFAFSKEAATEGVHRSKDYIPGAAVMGLLARYAYGQSETDSTEWDLVFHSGVVHFSDAVRISDNVPTFPNPAILLKPKHIEGDARLGREAFAKEHKSQQPEAIKGEYVSLDGSTVSPKSVKRRRVRTAIENRRAKTGSLFVEETIAPGKIVYRASVGGKIEPNTLHKLKMFLPALVPMGHGGGVFSVNVLASEDDNPWPNKQEFKNLRRVRIWFLSDCQLVDEFGNPKLVPEPSDFGLCESWIPVGSETSISARTDWPWNRTWWSRANAVSLIEAGSVVTYRNEKEQSGTLLDLVGIGLDRGYGRVALLADDFKHCAKEAFDISVATDASQEALRSDPIIVWAKKQSTANLMADSESGLSKWLQDRKRELESALQLAGNDAPTNAQWSKLRGLIPDFITGDSGLSNALKRATQRLSWDANYSGIGRWVQDILFKRPNNEEQVNLNQRAEEIKFLIDLATKGKHDFPGGDNA
ncbi:MAG: hypothetical protein RLZZ157_15 [Pseudomonadota bacterium]|jgi:hypothetical protein